MSFDATRYRMARAERAVAGERLHKERPLEAALFKRDRDLRPPRKVLGEKFEVSVAKVRKARNLADAGPNAPLLKRIILSPYTQDVARVRKAKYREGMKLEGGFRPKTVPALRAFRQEFPVERPGNPLKAFPTRLLPRPRPSLDAYLAWKEGR